MPTYEYECQKCKKRYDLFQPITDAPLKKCKFCNGKVQRLIGSGSGIIFKGSGFYATDYRKGADNQKKKDQPACPSAGKSPGCGNCPQAQ